MANRFRAPLAVTLMAILGFACSGCGARTSASRQPAAPGAVHLTLAETGSTLLYPLLRAWASAYHAKEPGVTITTAATGSGTGIEDASTGAAAIGASDAFLSSGNLALHPDLLNIPLAIAAQQVNYNLPRLRRGVHLRLDGNILARMYSGQITSWSDPAIAALNPGVALPATRVVPLHRIESSGDTFLFTSYLSTGDPSWDAGIGYGTTVAWPAVPGARSEKGNAGMVTGCAATPGCVAYIGISYLSQALASGLGEAELRNAAGRFTLPDGPSMRAAVAAFVSAIPANETISMVSGPAPAGYPIVNFEYAIVTSRQPTAARAAALAAFLRWAITSGNAPAFLDQVRFQPLPGPLVALAQAQIATIR